ncbi:ABC-2 type transport system ATP-binding protein [Amycolatopsis arida]|uniref:ABC-2 type transport system ATP-binding protein n=1 Tax=Amycolatopsis arida TaxID=587909 RepID=A0A1I5PTA2_9PSEU|nr:ABC transporter ATP-binding protein [Amycolatopsis arida]TDX98597.1 ABC-2 type transport system ATP-binding protein [Amycolatopsis arida]SFP37253.1 ABC-2 type transport system ATP-binding protein [Amycolatopsis arida]
MDDAVVVTDLVKRYRRGGPNAVDGLSFSVKRGEVFGLLGPNGAGKTTTVGVLTTRVLPTSGSAVVHGVDVVAHPSPARQLLAVVPQRNNLDRSLTIRQNLIFHAIYHGVGRAERNRRADEILEKMGLADKAKERVDFVSGGQSQRVMIARALMHRPKVLFLDEPSTGLDPQARLFVHERVAELRAEGMTVVLTTHDMDEAAKLSDRVGIVDHGTLLALDSPAALTRSLPGSTTLSVTIHLNGHGPDAVASALSGVDGVQRVEHVDGAAGGDARFRLYTAAEPAAVLPHVLTSASAVGCGVSDLSIGTPSLEDVFIHLTGRELR